MHQPKWFNNECDVKKSDVVLFLKQEGPLKIMYSSGIIQKIEKGKNEKIRKVIITFRNYNESVNWETRRGVKHIVMIHPVEETNITMKLGEIATAADISYKMSPKYCVVCKMLGAV